MLFRATLPGDRSHQRPIDVIKNDLDIIGIMYETCLHWQIV